MGTPRCAHRDPRHPAMPAGTDGSYRRLALPKAPNSANPTGPTNVGPRVPPLPAAGADRRLPGPVVPPNIAPHDEAGPDPDAHGAARRRRIAVPRAPGAGV